MQSVECTISETDKIGLLGRVKMNNGKGDGSVTMHWARSIPSLSVFEVGYHVYLLIFIFLARNYPYLLQTALTLAPGNFSLTGKIAKNFFSRAVVVFQPSLLFFPLQGVVAPSCSLGLIIFEIKIAFN